VNTEGYIIASTDLVRVGTFHEGALLTAQKKRKLIITAEDQLNLSGVKWSTTWLFFAFSKSLYPIPINITTYKTHKKINNTYTEVKSSLYRK
jgi:hypothetical protein